MKTPRFKSCVWALLLTLPLLRVADAQEQRPAVNSLHTLWEVKGSSNVVYLLGSIHLLKASDYPLAAPIEAAFRNAQVAVFETDVAEMQQPATQFKLLSKATLPAGETLEGQLSPEVFASFSNHVESSGFPLLIFNQLKPAMAAMTLQVLELQKLGLDPERGVDLYFSNLAQKENKEIVPLETVDFQIGLVTDFTKAEGELVMKTTLKEIDDTKKLYGEMLNDWKIGDAGKLAALLNDDMRETPTIYKRLVTDRNKRWLPKIEELLHGDKNAIVIVGAGHLVGKDGVVELLKNDGFKVTQL